MNLTQTQWTVVATSYREPYGLRGWRYEPGVNPRALQSAAENEDVIVMHRRAGTEWHVVARLPALGWRVIQQWRERKPLVLPHQMRGGR